MKYGCSQNVEQVYRLAPGVCRYKDCCPRHVVALQGLIEHFERLLMHILSLSSALDMRIQAERIPIQLQEVLNCNALAQFARLRFELPGM